MMITLCTFAITLSECSLEWERLGTPKSKGGLGRARGPGRAGQIHRCATTTYPPPTDLSESAERVRGRSKVRIMVGMDSQSPERAMHLTEICR